MKWNKLLEEEELEISGEENLEDTMIDPEESKQELIKKPEFKFLVRGTDFTIKELEKIIERNENGVDVSDIYIVLKSDADITDEEYEKFYTFIEDKMPQLNYEV